MVRHDAEMGVFVAELTMPRVVTLDGSTVLGLSNVGEARRVCQWKDLGRRIGLGGQDPIQFHKIVHINPGEVVIWYFELGHVDVVVCVYIGRELFVGGFLEVFSCCSRDTSSNSSQISFDEIKLSFVDLHGTGPHLLRLALGQRIEEFSSLVDIQHETVDTDLESSSRHNIFVIVLGILVFVDMGKI